MQPNTDRRTTPMRLNFMLSPLLFLCTLAQEITLTPARKLLDDLFPSTYETSVRPGSNDTATVVTIVPNKLILLFMDQQQETIQFSEEFLLSWMDPLLSWDFNATEYSRPWIKIPETSVWTPDIIFTAAMKLDEMMPIEERMADLRYDGTVRISNPSIVTYPCPLRIDSFPYDVQVCNLTIGPWNFNNEEVIVKSSTDYIAGLPQQFEGNSEWELSSIRAFSQLQPDSDETIYSSVVYQIELKRKPVYYVLVIQVI
ncbi:Neurotransmitter-gated ion-channel ligand binding domain protein [Ancylostoma caninum]|uniref:Neurotransmitter-gated ion-channel ligand binding domain protein n=1 Tax=Ancylostoma caninum TaxID=29170 RepID=A0A368G0P9_ANCCA|nr:Neurotransmitter-gated ion-channel ligand binding domain protein [Ancylostoma caninum]